MKPLLVIALILIMVPPGFCDITKEDIDQIVHKGELSHPYLFFSAQDLPALRERIENDPESRDIMARLLAEANRLLYTPVVKQIPQEGKNTRFTGLGEFEEIYYSYREWVLDLAFVYQVTGDEKYARKSFEFADALCDLPTWVIRAHQFPIIYSRVWPWNCDDDQVVFSFDIRAGSMSRILGTVYDWLYPALNRRQRDRIRGTLLEKGIIPVRSGWDYHWWASAYRCNWIGRCADGVGIASLALLTENPELTDVAAEAYTRLNRFYNEIGVDGGWQEGAGYYYGLHHCFYFADALKRLTGGKFNLFENPRFRANPVSFPLACTIPPHGMVDFCDGHFELYTAGRSHTYNKVASETRDPAAAWYRNTFYGAGDDLFDIIWPRSNLRLAHNFTPGQASRLFRTIDWTIMRSDFTDPNKVVVACKAGFNDDPHHGHLDIGQFAVYWRGEGYISDLGSPPYDEQYFDERRWEYVHTSSRGHNVILVNGELQSPAKRKNRPWKDGIGGKVLEFRSGADRDYTLMDPTNAYTGGELKSWRRHVILDKPEITVVLDEVKARAGAEIEARFHSQGSVSVKDGYALIRGSKGTMAMIPVSLVDETDGANDFILKEGREPSLPVRSDVDFSWIPHFSTVVIAGQETTLIGTVLVTVANEAEARDSVRSINLATDSGGNVSLSFAKNGKFYYYTFILFDSGLVLK